MSGPLRSNQVFRSIVSHNKKHYEKWLQSLPEVHYRFGYQFWVCYLFNNIFNCYLNFTSNRFAYIDAGNIKQARVDQISVSAERCHPTDYVYTHNAAIVPTRVSRFSRSTADKSAFRRCSDFRKPTCQFMLVINCHKSSISHRFRDITLRNRKLLF